MRFIRAHGLEGVIARGVVGPRTLVASVRLLESRVRETVTRIIDARDQSHF